MSSTKYAEKQVGYMVTSVLLNEVRLYFRSSGASCALTPKRDQLRVTSSCAWSSTR